MYCNECGYAMPEGTTVCPVCNAIVVNQNQRNLITYNVNNEETHNISSQANAYNNVGKNTKPTKKPVKWIIPCVCVLIILIVGGIGIGIGIKIASKGEGNTEADTQAETTKQQITTSTEAATEMTAETTEEITTEYVPPEPVEISVSEIPEMEKLETFIGHMTKAHFVEFDCEDVSDDFAVELITIPECQIADFSIAPDFSDDYSFTNDPLGKFDNTAYKLSVDTVNWIEKNVFNLSDSDINRINNKRVDNSDVYESDGYYYMYHGGIGFIGYHQEYTKAKYDGKYYYVTIDLYDDNAFYINGNSIAGLSAEDRFEYKLELKEVDGVVFWSVYSCRSLLTDWARAYLDHIREVESQDNQLLETYVINIDDDSIPELVIYWSLDGGNIYSEILSYQNGNIIRLPGRNGSLSYIEKENLFYETSVGPFGPISILFKIENGEFVEIGSTGCSDKQETFFRWEEQEITEDEYNRLLAEHYDSSKAKKIHCSDDPYAMPPLKTPIYEWLLEQYQ